MKIGILTSGGDAPGMNAAIRAVVKSATKKGIECYGIFRGFEGLIDADIKQIDKRFVSDTIQRGGTILQTARSPRFMTEEGRLKAKSVLNTFGIDALVAIGGDGTMHGAAALDKLGITVMFIPGTIDNDVAYTDYTVGFDTAVNTALDAISKIKDTTDAHDRAIVVEVMGRNCGDIAIAAGLAGGAEKILVPGCDVDVNEICRELLMGQGLGRRHYIIVKAEGVAYDTSKLAKDIEERTGHECKAAVLSYVQRGGTPTANDRIRASLMGVKAVELIEGGSPSRAIGLAGSNVLSYPLEEAMQIRDKKPVIDMEVCEAIV